MKRNQDALDRLTPLFAPPERGLEDLLARRQHKERARKLGAIALVTAIVTTFVAIGLGILDTRTQVPVEQPDTIFEQISGWIVYREGDAVVAVDPSDPSSRITLAEATGFEPMGWSRDGGSLLGRREADLFVMGADGTEVQIVDGVPGYVTVFRSWWGSIAPDGAQVVYANNDDEGLYTVDVNGGRSRLIERHRREPFIESPAWSPDGSRIALLDFLEESSHTYGLTVVNPDGSGRVVEIDDLGVGDDAQGLVWSPDGSRLAFFASALEGTGRIYVIDTATWTVRQLTHGADSRWPTWSPDGSRIAFISEGRLVTMQADGDDVQQVGDVRPTEAPMAWTPGGAES